ncbi:RNA-binding S4 domain-containing protein [Sharpea porci]|uniref:RNA-binding S4 domain-containing protein n=1 Tax=Sharpea porci TaxID=2652286 RepID=UPI002A91AC4E|nr:RNA-binding S4 domain-containing protein [Sharpea porci]MDY5278817.1 RNA-binding S4 domain-containing protein [Sharpea porci]
MKDLEISTEYITLGQAMKLSGAASSGFEAKVLIQEGEVTVNGEVDTHRGKKLHDGDVFGYDGETYRITCKSMN